MIFDYFLIIDSILITRKQALCQQGAASLCRAGKFPAPCREFSCAVRTMLLRRADIVSAPCKQHISLGLSINLDDKYLLQDSSIYLIINILANKMTFFGGHGCGTVAA